MTDIAQQLAQNAEDLGAALSKAFGSPAQNLIRMSAGASQEIWSFDVPDNKDMPALVLRRSHGGIGKLSSAQLSLADEARLLEVSARNELASALFRMARIVSKASNTPFSAIAQT